MPWKGPLKQIQQTCEPAFWQNPGFDDADNLKKAIEKIVSVQVLSARS